MVIDARNEDIVVQASGCAEDVTGVIQAVSGGRVVGHGLTGTEGPVEITSVIDQVQHGRIDPDPARIQVLELCGSKGGGPAVYVYILKDTLAERRRRNDALGALLLTLAGLRCCTWRESSSSVFCPCLSWLNHPHGKFL
jgi:hypothetical protein